MSSYLHHILRRQPGKYYIIQGNLSEKEINSRKLNNDITHHFREEVFEDKLHLELSAESNYSNAWIYEVEVTPRDGIKPSTIIITSLGTYFHGKHSPPDQLSFA